MDGIAKFLFEINTLKRMHRTGWTKEGIPNPESIADHSFRNAIIGFVLARMEGADVDKVVKMCIFHDMAEVRVGDVDKVMQRYIDKDEAEHHAMRDQLAQLPEPMRSEIAELITEYEERATLEARVAKDADVLELILQAKEYADNGYRGCEYWIEKRSPALKTESAKKILESAKQIRADSWWKGLENLKKDADNNNGTH